MNGRAIRILLSGFEPFNGADVNPSELIVQRLAREGVGDDRVELHTVILPVEDGRAGAALFEAFDRVRPDVVLCLGESARASAITFERIFINLKDYRIPDNSGRTAVDQPVVPDGPVAYFATLPVRRLIDAAEQAGAGAAASLSAGAFLCNQVAYELMHRLARDRVPIPAGFIHVPRLPEAPSQREAPLGEMCCAIVAVVRVLADDLVSEKSGSADQDGG